MQDQVTPPLLYRRPLIKLSGEALMGAQGSGIDPQELRRIAEDVAATVRSGCHPALVVGGGNIFRGVAGVASGMNRVTADQMGMLATVMNGLALKDALISTGIPAAVFSGLPVPAVCQTYTFIEARRAMDEGLVVIFAGGTGNPFFTTDTAAALRAAEMGCDAILKATNVDGVYSADPRRDPAASRYDRLTFTEVLARDLKVMDAAAIALARDNQIPIVVFSLHEKGAIAGVLYGARACTVISDAACAVR